jgi:hypothetical protein
MKASESEESLSKACSLAARKLCEKRRQPRRQRRRRRNGDNVGRINVSAGVMAGNQ